MAKIAAHEFVSLDGVYENPSWTAPYGFTDKMGEALGAITGGASAILLGRRTWEMFAPAWDGRTAEDDPGAPFFNDTTKHVVSSSLEDTSAWRNSQVLGAYDAAAIRALKDAEEGDIYISGSGTLVRALLADGLLDELHLLVYPVALGEGEHLLDAGTSAKLALLGTEGFDNGVVHLTYGPAAD